MRYWSLLHGDGALVLSDSRLNSIAAREVARVEYEAGNDVGDIVDRVWRGLGELGMIDISKAE